MKSLKLYLIIASVLLALYIIAQLNRPKIIDWSESFSDNEKTPFGTYILYNQVKDIFPGSETVRYRQPVYSLIAEDSVKDATYIIVCQSVEFTKADYDELTKYISKGNDVFIAAEYFGRAFEKYLDINTKADFKFNNNSITPIKFLNPYLNTQKQYAIDKGAGGIFFGKFDTLRTTVIGENVNHQANFIKYNVGKGSLYLVCNPKLLSNYSLLNGGTTYAAVALSYLKNTKKIIWDEYYTQGDIGNESPMRVFLSNTALQWAYYIAIFSLLIFVLFEIKRTQRIIPVIEPLANTTLEFVNIVGQVYYEKRDNTNIAHKKIVYLLEYLRDEYRIKTNKIDDDLAENLAAKLGIERRLADELVSMIKYISVQDTITDHDLIHLNRLIEQFYTKST